MTINFVNNTNFVNKITPVKMKLNKAISFKGALEKDMIEIQSKMPKDIATQMSEDIIKLDTVKSQIAVLREEVADLMKKYSSASLELEDAYKLGENSKYKPYIKQKEEAFQLALKALQDKVQEKYALVDSIEGLEENVKSWDLCKQKFEENDRLAALYNPRLNKKERLAQAKEIGNVIETKDLMEDERISKAVLSSWVDAELLDVRKIGNEDKVELIDLEEEKNKKLLSEINAHIDDCISGTDFSTLYSYSSSEFAEALKDGSFKTLGYPEGLSPRGPVSSLVDMKSPITKKALVERNKTVPFPSQKYSLTDGAKDVLVPASYLSKLGFGTTEQIKDLIRSGKISGTVRKNTSKNIVPYVYLDDANSQKQLLTLRKQNPHIEEAKELAKRLGISLNTIKEAMTSGEIEIIKEYVLPEDAKKLYVDNTNPNNVDFIDRLSIETILKDEAVKIRNQRLGIIETKTQDEPPKTPLRAQLIWEMCPKTRKTGISYLSSDSFLCNLLTKDYRKLTPTENKLVQSYKNEMWRRSGILEFKCAQYKATQIMNDFETGGIDAVQDKEARKIIAEYIK